jgi:hypothetical protein
MALFNLARMTTATVGTGTITLGAAVPGFLTFAQAGVGNGVVVSYGITDGNNSEVGTGTYTSTGTTLTRTVVKSTNADAAINLSGNAQVAIIALASDIAMQGGTPMLFQQGTAPTGWTKQTTHNDKALRVVSGGASSGGVISFSSCFTRTYTDGYTITTTEMPSHNHPGTFYANTSGGSYGPLYGGPNGPVGSMIAYEGGQQPHYHGMDIRVQYVDCIIATKD